MHAGIIRLKLNSPPNALHGGRVPPYLMRDEPQRMPRFRMARLRCHDLAVESLRFPQVPGSVVLARKGKDLGDGHGREEGWVAHHCRHMARKATSMLRAKPPASISGETSIRARIVDRSAAMRGRSVAVCAARRT